MRLSAIDCIQRGLISLRANWELVLVAWLQTITLLLLLALGLLPPLLVVGWGEWDLLSGDRGDFEALLAEALARLTELAMPLIAALVAAFAVWTLAFLLFCWFQAGIYGILLTADRQAPPAGSRDPRVFRTFSWSLFANWGGRCAWRFFWLFNLYTTALLVVVLALVVLAAGAVAAGQQWGVGAGIGIGCGGALPLLFVLIVLALWFVLAQADLAREDSGVFEASRSALETLGRRFGGVLLIMLVFGALGLAIGMVFLPVSLTIETLLAEQPLWKLVASLVVMGLQYLLSGALNLALGGSLVALMRTERVARAQQARAGAAGSPAPLAPGQAAG